MTDLPNDPAVLKSIDDALADSGKTASERYATAMCILLRYKIAHAQTAAAASASTAHTTFVGALGVTGATGSFA